MSRFSLFLTVGVLAFVGQSQYGRREQTPPAPPALTPFIDVHTHFDEHDPEGAVRAVLQAITREKAAKIYLQIPPFGADDSMSPMSYDAEVILPALKTHAGRVGVLGGGGTLNPIIMRSVATGDVGPSVRQTFKDRAEALLRMGVSGFGEMAAEHFVGATPYESAPPDHPLYLLLSDIAAEHQVPIDIHMEAVPNEMPLPVELKSPPNAARLHPNVAAFERLLAHNPRTRIIWAHLGTDNTGFRTPEESRRLLRAHSNLYMEIKSDPRAIGKNPVLVDQNVSPQWLSVLKEFPDRFLIGSDQHYPEDQQPSRWSSVVMILNQLPADLRQKVGLENPQRLFGRLK
jgi:predicted TIM-barrel fold metal-dependent hydrolase